MKDTCRVRSWLRLHLTRFVAEKKKLKKNRKTTKPAQSVVRQRFEPGISKELEDMIQLALVQGDI